MEYRIKETKAYRFFIEYRLPIWKDDIYELYLCHEDSFGIDLPPYPDGFYTIEEARRYLHFDKIRKEDEQNQIEAKQYHSIT